MADTPTNTVTNKVVFGISNVYYSVIKANGEYDTPVHMPGAVSLSVTREGSVDDFWADNIKFCSFDSANGGYSGTLEMAYVDKTVLTTLCGYKVNATTGAVYEDSNASTTRFALLYEVSSNVSPDRFVFYDCVLSRPESDANTRTDSTDPDTQSLDITMAPHKFSDDLYCAKSFCTKGDAAFDNWFGGVVLPNASSLS